MIIREMLDIQTPHCKICTGLLNKKMVMRDDYKGHLFVCHDCNTEYRIVGEGQSDIELEVEYERSKG